MKIVVAPDSFKGTLSAEEVAGIVAEELRKQFPCAEIVQLPLGDGGEGTARCIWLALGGAMHQVKVTSPFLGRKTNADVLITNSGTAVLESAQAMGLPLVGKHKNPMITTTYGVGEMIKFALQQGAKKIVITLGGSSTNDGGAGMAAALGVKFFGSDGISYVPTGGTLWEVDRVELGGMASIVGVEFEAMCDVKNPLCGQLGASQVYAPQKGATSANVKALECGMKRYAEVLEKSLGRQGVSKEPGSGAAGGLGFGAKMFLGAKLESGIKTVFKLIDFEEKIKDADLIVTGEGRFDSQSLMGKVVGGVAEVAAKYKKPVVVVTGVNEAESVPSAVRGVVVTNPKQLSMKEVAPHADAMLRSAVNNYANVFADALRCEKIII